MTDDVERALANPLADGACYHYDISVRPADQWARDEEFATVSSGGAGTRWMIADNLREAAALLDIGRPLEGGRPADAAAPVAREDTASPDEAARTAPCPDCGAVVGALDSIPSLAPVIDDHKWLGVLCSGSGTALDRPAPAQPTEAPDAQRAAPTRDTEAVDRVFWSLTAMRGEETIPLGVRAKLAELADTLGPACVELGGGADGGGEDDGPTQDEVDDLRWESLIDRKIGELAGAAGIDRDGLDWEDILGCVRVILDALRDKAGAKANDLVAPAVSVRVGVAGAPHPDVARLARAAGVSPDSGDVVGAIEAAIRAGRAGHEDLFAAEADYWQKRHGAVAGRVRAAVKALSGGGEHYLMEPGLESRPEPPVGTTFTNPETGEIAWQRQDDGWHCTRADCWNCPAGWDEVCDWGRGVDGLVRHLPVVRVGTGGGES